MNKLNVKLCPYHVESSQMTERINPAFEDDFQPNLQRSNPNVQNISSSSDINSIEKSTKLPPFSSRLIILKNLAVLSFGFVIMFTAFMSLTNLESSINREHGLGTMSLSVIYIALVISCLVLPSTLIRFFGLKKTMVFSMILYIPYFVANFYPTWYTLLPSSIAMGLGAAPLWTAKCSYVTELAKRYQAITSEEVSNVLVRFFGFFFMAFQTSQIWGNLIAYQVLEIPSEDQLNLSRYSFNETTNHSCGIYFNEFLLEDNSFNTTQPLKTQIDLLCGIFTGCSLAAVLLLLIFLDDIIPVGDESTTSSSTIKDAFKEVYFQAKDPFQIALIPITLFSGLLEGFIFGDFTGAYVACGWGISHVGVVMISFGLVNAVCSYAAGPLTKLIGRLAVISGGVVLTTCAIALMFLWHPDSNKQDVFYLFYVAAILLGAGDSVWKTQIIGFYGVVFNSNCDAAYSNYRLWESMGFVLSFGYSSYLSNVIKLNILCGVLAAGFFGYLFVEIKLNPNLAKAKEKAPKNNPVISTIS